MCLISSIRLQNPWDLLHIWGLLVFYKKKKWAQFSLLSDNGCAGETIEWLILVMLLYNIWETEGKGVTCPGSCKIAAQVTKHQRCPVFMWWMSCWQSQNWKPQVIKKPLALNQGLLECRLMSPQVLDNFFQDLQMNLGGAISEWEPDKLVLPGASHSDIRNFCPKLLRS